MAEEIASEILVAFIERVERLQEEKDALTADMREVFAEAKGSGFDTKAIRQLIRLRKLDTVDRVEQETLLEIYKDAVGMG